MTLFTSVVERWGAECVYCGTEATTKDHLIPSSRKGSNSIENLRPSCQPCNIKKASLTPIEWLGDDCPEDLRGFVTDVPDPHDRPRRHRKQMPSFEDYVKEGGMYPPLDDNPCSTCEGTGFIVAFHPYVDPVSGRDAPHPSTYREVLCPCRPHTT